MTRTVSAYSHAPPSSRSSRATPVIVAYFRPIVCTDSATRRGSSRSRGCGLPVSIWQKSQRRVHWSPPMRNVASRSSQHSKMLGQPASWQTVWSPSDFTRLCRCLYSGPILARVLIHSGLRSIGVSALRTSSRRSLRPSGAGACVTWTNCTRAPEALLRHVAAPERQHRGRRGHDQGHAVVRGAVPQRQLTDGTAVRVAGGDPHPLAGRGRLDV